MITIMLYVFTLLYMQMATITARIDEDKKAKLTELCHELGLSVGTLINIWVNNFVRSPQVHVELDDTHPSYYDHPDAIEVNEPIEVVQDYLQKLVDKDE